MSTSSSIQLPTVATVDGWELQSNSINQPTEAEVIERLKDPPPEQKTETKPVEKPAEEAPAPEPEISEQSETSEEAKPKKKTVTDRTQELKARIGYETRQYYEAKRQREAEEAELLRIREAREAELRAREKPADERTERKAPSDGRPTWSQFEADGKSYDEFVEARSEFDRAATVEATRKAVYDDTRRRQIAADHERLAAQHDRRMKATIEKHPDFVQLVNENLSDVDDSPFLVAMVQRHRQGGDVLYHMAKYPEEARVLSTMSPSRSMFEGIATSDNPVELLSYFAQHPEEFEQLNALDPRTHAAVVLKSLGRLEARLVGAKDGSPTAESVSNAKPPLRPVVGGRTSVPKNLDEMEFGPEWIRLENQRERERKKLGRV